MDRMSGLVYRARVNQLKMVLCSGNTDQCSSPRAEPKLPPESVDIAISQTTSDKDMPPVIYKTWDDGFLVRRLTEKDAIIVQQWYNAMDPCAPDLEIALAANLKGLYVIGEYKGEPVAAFTRINVVDGLWYDSYLYVVEEFRRKGIRSRLYSSISGHESEQSMMSSDTIFDIKQQIGLKRNARTRTFVGKVLGNWTLKVQQKTIQVSEESLNHVLEYDNKCFIRPNSEQRRKLLQALMSIPGGACFVALDKDGSICGYGCRRPLIDKNGFAIGPLYADSYDIAYALMHNLCSEFPEAVITIDICLEYTGAVKLVEVLGLKGLRKLTRVYINGHPGHLSEKVFGLTSMFICGYLRKPGL